MKSLRTGFLLLILTLAVNVHAEPWITAYVGGWWLGTNDNGQMPVSKIDFAGMTVCDHMALLPKAEFPFIDTAEVNHWVPNAMFLGNSLKLTTAAHAAGVKCTFTIGAWGTEKAFLAATRPSKLNEFVRSLTGFLKQRKYDGVDVDWEPLRAADTTQWKDLVVALRKALPSPRYLITVTAGWGAPANAYASIQNYVDQINIMTYDFDTDAPGYNTWYSSSVYSDGVVDPYDNKTPVPSCSYMVGLFEKAGVRPQRLGIGCEPGGDLWTGVWGPNQSVSKVVSWKPDIPYDTIVTKYYKPDLYHWDSGAKAAYLSFDATGARKKWFLSYDDPKSMKAKLAYLESAGLGGMIVYEIGMSYNKETGDNPFLDVSRSFLKGKMPSKAGRGTSRNRSIGQ